MPITLDGTLGIDAPLGTSSVPSYGNTTSTNTGLYFPSSTTLGLSTNGTAALTIDASQNVGIGTTSPSTYGKFAVVGNDGNGVGYFFGATGGMRLGGYNAAYSGSSIEAVNAAQSAYQPMAINGSYTVLATGGSERMRIDSSGNVGIGTSSPSANSLTLASKVIYMSSGYGICWDSTATQIAGYNTNILQFITSSSERMRIDSNGNLLVNRTTVSGLAGTSGHIVLNDSIPSGTLAIGGFGSFLGRQASDGSTVLNTGQGSIIFSRGSYGSTSEAMRIDSSNKVLIGTTGAFNGRLSVGGSGQSATFYNTAAGQLSTPAVEIVKIDNNTTTSQTFLQFFINSGGSGSGQINANGANTAAFGSFSDERLKENIVNLPPQLENICTLRPVEFDYKDGSGHQIGFVAQEMQEVYPDVVGVGADDMLTITGWSKTEARLVKAIQELKAELDALKGTK